MEDEHGDAQALEDLRNAHGIGHSAADSTLRRTRDLVDGMDHDGVIRYPDGTRSVLVGIDPVSGAATLRRL